MFVTNIATKTWPRQYFLKETQTFLLNSCEIKLIKSSVGLELVWIYFVFLTNLAIQIWWPQPWLEESCSIF